LEGLYLDAGVLHSYLQGAGMEIMANSDNVLRGGLTTKHIDTNELLHVLDFTQRKIAPIKPVKVSASEQLYKTPAEEFALSVIKHIKNKKSDFQPSNSPEIIFCYEGDFVVENLSQFLPLVKGQSLFVPYEMEGYSIQGTGTIFRAKLNV
jgi:mannose-6-phosphate isomerase